MLDETLNFGQKKNKISVEFQIMVTNLQFYQNAKFSSNIRQNFDQYSIFW